MRKLVRPIQKWESRKGGNRKERTEVKLEFTGNSLLDVTTHPKLL